MKQVDFIFLSDADFSVLGCLPYLYKNGMLKSAQIFATSPVAKLGAQALFEFLIQKKESGPFSAYSLEDIESVFSMIQLVSFDERKRIKVQETELIVSALPSGKAIGSAIWKIEINKFNVFYALDLNDQSQQIS
jgi:Cft2 family RNA processing exonuclease